MGKKVIIIGDGAVGATYAYTLQTLDLANEIGIIDLNVDKAWADAMDMVHAEPWLTGAPKKIFAADYSDLKDADLVVITASVPQPLETTDRLQMLTKNVKVISNITRDIVASGFKGIYLVASNPADVMTQVVYNVAGVDRSRVLCSGTTLDTARMRSAVGEKLGVEPRSVGGFTLGEHGSSAFVAWSTVSVASENVEKSFNKAGIRRTGRFSDQSSTHSVAKTADFDAIAAEVVQVAFDIFHKKGNTSYGIASSLARVTKAIFDDEKVVLPISTYLEGEYGESDVFISVPAVIGANGVERIIEIDLPADEQAKLNNSANIVRDAFASIKDML
jgi:L-lactate dehydrogenase